ncbi:twitching motility protein PilT [Salarchaeum japonicum]|uniref:twitching motility protein PilT n=1 Tax=Salarchaeum japonicum TaxID=555573 RepID=UPI003C786A13
MTRVAVDANALMMPVEAGVRLFDELDRLVGTYDAVVPEPVLAELDSLSESGGEEGRAASVGADLAARCSTIATTEPYADDALHALGESGAVDAVVTNDAPLKERLLDAGVPVIHLRGRNQLTRTQP